MRNIKLSNNVKGQIPFVRHLSGVFGSEALLTQKFPRQQGEAHSP